MTQNPEEKLHISGVSNIINSNLGNTGLALITPTIRVDGLNINNNPTAFEGANTVAPLYADSNGDLSVKKGIEAFGNYILPGQDALVNSTILNVVANYNYHLTGNLLSTTFNLKQRSVVYISSNISIEIQNTAGGTITDGKPRAISALLLFTSAPASSGIPVNITYTSESIVYSNRTPSSINGYFKLAPTSEIVLPAGTYTVALRGAGAAGNNSPAEDFRVIWGGGTGDKLNVLAKPL